MDWLKFGFADERVFGVCPDGVVLVSGSKSSELGVGGDGGIGSEEPVREVRFEARCSGRKMPEPGTVVVKYRMLGRVRSLACSA